MTVRGSVALFASAMALVLATEASAAVRTYAYSAKVGGPGVSGDRGAELWLNLGIAPGDVVSFEATYDDAAPTEIDSSYAMYSASALSLKLNGHELLMGSALAGNTLGASDGVYRFAGQSPGVMAPYSPGFSRTAFLFDAAAPMLPGFALPAALPIPSSGTLSFNIWDTERWGQVQYTLTDWTAVTAPVPEPATWALLIAGFGMAGAALRQRRRCRALSI